MMRSATRRITRRRTRRCLRRDGTRRNPGDMMAVLTRRPERCSGGRVQDECKQSRTRVRAAQNAARRTRLCKQTGVHLGLEQFNADSVLCSTARNATQLPLATGPSDSQRIWELPDCWASERKERVCRIYWV